MTRRLTHTVFVFSVTVFSTLLAPAARAVETVRLAAAAETRAGIEIRPGGRAVLW